MEVDGSDDFPFHFGVIWNGEPAVSFRRWCVTGFLGHFLGKMGG